VEINDDEVYFATSEPFNTDWVEEVEKTIKKKIILKVANAIQIEQFIEEFYALKNVVRQIKKEHNESNLKRTEEIDKMLGEGNSKKFASDDSAISEIVDWLFQYAYDERATDIHIEPRQGKAQVRFRVDGTMRIVYKFDPEIILPIVSRIKILADLKVDEKRRPQDGRLRARIKSNVDLEFRLSTIPTLYGEKLVIRIFNPKMSLKTVRDLGFREKDIKKWDELIHLTHGLILVTGPTGSGKSTTLHTSLRIRATKEVNICTVEDPIEIVNDEFNQMQVNPKIDITFGNAIRSFLRQDPDIIMVGEIRDPDAANMAIQAALTGHLVFSSLHTNDAISSIPRLIDLGIPAHLLNAVLKGIVAQRLIRILCPFCKKKEKTAKASWKQLVQNEKLEMPEEVFIPVGCSECKDVGFKERVCIYEMVAVDDSLRKLIRNDASLDEIKKNLKNIYTPMRINGAEKVIAGETSIEEILRVVA